MNIRVWFDDFKNNKLRDLSGKLLSHNDMQVVIDCSSGILGIPEEAIYYYEEVE